MFFNKAMQPLVKQMAHRLAKEIPGAIDVAHRIKRKRWVKTLGDLDSCIEEALGGNTELTAESLAKLSGFQFKLPNRLLPRSNPFEKGYHAEQMSIYSFLSGKTYGVENESTPFDFEATKNNHYPYNTGSCEIIGSQLQSIGFLIRNLNLKQGSKIVEFGAGWGNLALPLAQSGFDVTAVEMNGPSASLIRHRGNIVGRSIQTVETDMLEYAETTTDIYDAAIFMSSFHHVSDPIRMVKAFNRLIKPNGIVYFNDEPIFPTLNPILPYDWGIRLDGQSLFVIRKLGWLEMGFQRRFMKEMLNRSGWKLQMIPSMVKDVSDLYFARRAD
jgi:2-polyprenyl-3-methyl-5-hydroxy-6-metoxy-1,4-benzoquinol methylase